MSEASAVPDPEQPIEPDEPEETPEPVAPPGPGIVAAIVWLILFFLAQALLVTPVSFLNIGPQYALPVTTMAIFLAALLILGLGLGRGWRRTLALRGLAWTHVACVLLLVPVLFLLYSRLGWVLDLAYQAAGVADEPIEAHALYGDFVDFLGGMPIPQAVLYVVVFFGALPGVGEELLYRGFIGRGLVAQRGVLVGILLTSFFFGIMHAHPIQSVSAAVIGIVMHVLFLWSRSLSASILYHVTHNSASAAFMLVLGSVPQESIPAWLGAAEAPWPLVGAAGLSVVALGWLYHRSRVQWLLPDGSAWWPGYFDTAMPPAELGARAIAGHPGIWPVILAVLAYVVFIGTLGWVIVGQQ
jgi:uncharacterized protein